MKASNTFGQTIRALREEQNVPLRVVAAAVEIDSTMLSKLERGERFPTTSQLEKFAKYFEFPLEELSAKAIADRFLAQYGEHPGAKLAISYVKERFSTYETRK